MNDVQARSDPRRRVVVGVGVDGTPDSLAALRRAASQARKRGADLDIVYVIPAAAKAAAEASGYEMLGVSVRSVARDGLGAGAHAIVARGAPGAALVRRSDGAEPLVIGARVRSGDRRRPGGDVVAYCLAQAGCPVDICTDQRAGPAAQPARPRLAGPRPAAVRLAFRETGSDLR